MNHFGLFSFGLAVVIFLVGSALVLSAVASPGNIPTSGTLYGTDGGGGNLYTFNPTTGADTLAGNLGIGQTGALAGNATTLYAGTSGVLATSGNLYSVNPVGPVSTLIGNSGLGPAGYGSFDFDNSGVLYASINLAGGSGTGSDYLVTVNTATGVATVVGSFGTCSGVTIPAPPSGGTGSCTIEGMDAIAFDTSDQLWGIENVRGASGAPGLYKINKATGAATFQIAITSGPIDGVVSAQFACDGTLYGGSARQTDGGRLGKLNTSTGGWTFLTPTQTNATWTGGPQFNSLGGLAVIPSTCPTPTPSPTQSATPSPTASPTLSPTPSPTASPTPSPTASPTPSPTHSPSPTPSPTATAPASVTPIPSNPVGGVVDVMTMDGNDGGTTVWPALLLAAVMITLIAIGGGFAYARGRR